MQQQLVIVSDPSRYQHDYATKYIVYWPLLWDSTKSLRRGYANWTFDLKYGRRYASCDLLIEDEQGLTGVSCKTAVCSEAPIG